jgi:hypothetical protein
MEYQGFQGGSGFRDEPRDPHTPPQGGKRDFEEKLEEVAERVSKTVSEGVKRLEEAAANIGQCPEFSEGRVKRFFTSSLGGLVVTIIGILWFFNAVGLFQNWVVALIVTGIGIYMIFRFRSDAPKP